MKRSFNGYGQASNLILKHFFQCSNILGPLSVTKALRIILIFPCHRTYILHIAHI